MDILCGRLLFSVLFLIKALSAQVLPQLLLNPQNAGFLVEKAVRYDGAYNQELILTNRGTALPQVVTNLARYHRNVSLGGREMAAHLETSVHMINPSITPNDNELHFLCHSHSLVNQPPTNEASPGQESGRSFCCAVAVDYVTSVTRLRQLNVCEMKTPLVTVNPSVCHTSIALDRRAWDRQWNHKINVSYLVFPREQQSNYPDTRYPCNMQRLSPEDFVPLGHPILRSSVGSESKEVGGVVSVEVPRRSLKIGDQILIPVMLKKASVKQFVLRTIIRQKTFVEFVKLSDGLAEGWIAVAKTIATSDGGNLTEVTASLKKNIHFAFMSDEQMKSPIFTLEFRVVSPPRGQRRLAPRLFWSLEQRGPYSPPRQLQDQSSDARGDKTRGQQKRSPMQSRSSSSPVVTRLNIESSKYKDIVAVVKVTDVVNTAIITGLPVHHSLWIYGLTHELRLHDVSVQASCHSLNPKTLRLPASRSCAALVFDGRESLGAATLVAKFQGRHCRLRLEVWGPQLPLTIRLSDRVLSAVKGWKVQRKMRTRRSPTVARSPRSPRFRFFNDLYDNQGGDSPAAVWDMSPDTGASRSGGFERKQQRMGKTKKNKKRKVESPCRRRYQQAEVTVLARFVRSTRPTSEADYLGGNSASLLDVTHLVQNRLQVRPSHSADLIGRHLIGRSAAPIALIFLPSPRQDMGRLGAANFTVSNEKVRIVKMGVNLITDLSLTVTRMLLPTSGSTARYMASTRLSSTRHLRTPGHSLLLAHWIQFSDGSSLSLSDPLVSGGIATRVTSLNRRLIEVVNATSPWPRIQMLPGPGLESVEGDLLEITLNMPGICRRARDLIPPIKVRLKVTPPQGVHGSIPIDRKSENKPEDEGPTSSAGLLSPSSTTTSLPVTKPLPASHGSMPLKDAPDGRSRLAQLEGGKSARGKGDVKDPSKKNRPGEEEGRLTAPDGGRVGPGVGDSVAGPMSIGLYALLGLFGTAALAFTVNCGLMAVRYRKRRCLADSFQRSSLFAPESSEMSQSVQTTKDNSWVWMSGNTLKRNAVNTHCTQLLLPVDQFPLASVPAEKGSCDGTGGSRTSAHEERENGLMSPGSTGSSGSQQRHYEGQECSIRIVTNPLPPPDQPPPPIPAFSSRQKQQQQQAQQSKAADPRMTTNSLTSHTSSNHVPKPPLRTTSKRPLSHPNVRSGTPIAGTELGGCWDEDMLALNYDQLMDYFSNLKESVA